MKTLLPLLLALCLMLSACGTTPSSASEAAAATEDPLLAAARGEDPNATPDPSLPLDFAQGTLVDPDMGYHLEAVDPAQLSLDITQPGFYSDNVGAPELDGTTPILRQSLDGTTLLEISVATSDADHRIASFQFVSHGLWLLRATLEDDPTYTLEHWDVQGTLLSTQPLTAILPEEAPAAAFLALSPTQDLLLLTQEALYWLSDTGEVQDTLDLSGVSYTTATDRSGVFYLVRESDNTLLPILWDTHTLGDPILSCGSADCIFPGTGPYDFLLDDNQSLRGVDLQAATVTELVQWADCDLLGSVSRAYVLEDGTLLVSVYSYLQGTAQLLQVTQVPLDTLADPIPLTMAVGVAQNLVDMGCDWTNTTYRLSSTLSDFNRQSDYHLEVVQFSQATDLNLLVASGEIPDLFCWSGVNLDTLRETYGKKGYLQDLEPLMNADEDLSLDHFLPQVVEASRSQDGSLYAMPTSCLLEFVVGRADLVGTQSGWSFTQLYAAAQANPETFVVTDASWTLKEYLQYALGNFVDKSTGTCNFQDPEFAALMNLCRDFQGQEPDLTYDSPLEPVISGDRLLQVDMVFSTAVLACEDLPQYQQNGLTLVGFPGVGGNGCVLVPQTSFSLSASSGNQEAAWSYLMQLYSYDYQISQDFTVRRDALVAGQKAEFAAYGYAYSPQDAEAALAIYDDAVCPTCLDDTILDIILEEVAPFLDGTKPLSQIRPLLENRITIYLSEQS